MASSVAIKPWECVWFVKSEDNLCDIGTKASGVLWLKWKRERGTERGKMEGLGFHLMVVSSVTLWGRHHILSLCGPRRDTRSASGKPVETEENQVLILDSSGDAQNRGGGRWGWCKERQKRKIEGERQKCDWIRACGLKSNCLLLDPSSPSLSSADRMWPDISILALSGLWPGGWNISRLPFLSLTFSPSISPSFLCYSQSLPLISLWSYSLGPSPPPPLLSHHCCLPIFPSPGWQWADTVPVVGSQPSREDVAVGISCLILLQSPERLISPHRPSLLSASYHTYVIPLMVLNSGVWAVCALRCEK